MTTKREPKAAPDEAQEWIVGGKRYKVKGAEIIAWNESDEAPEEHPGLYLYRTEKGNFFSVNTGSPGSTPAVIPLQEVEAMQTYTGLTNRRLTEKQAFPNIEIEDA